MIMNQIQLEPKEQELISKILDFRFELGTTIVCLKDIFAKITLKLDGIPPVYKDNFDVEELKGLRHDVKYFINGSAFSQCLVHNEVTVTGRSSQHTKQFFFCYYITCCVASNFINQ